MRLSPAALIQRNPGAPLRSLPADMADAAPQADAHLPTNLQICNVELDIED